MWTELEEKKKNVYHLYTQSMMSVPHFIPQNLSRLNVNIEGLKVHVKIPVLKSAHTRMHTCARTHHPPVMGFSTHFSVHLLCISCNSLKCHADTLTSSKAMVPLVGGSEGGEGVDSDGPTRAGVLEVLAALLWNRICCSALRRLGCKRSCVW